MFYLWLFSSGYLAFLIIAQFMLIQVGFVPNFMDIIFAFVILIVTTSLAYKQFKEPHKASYSLMAVGHWMIYIGIFFLIGLKRVYTPLTVALRFEVGVLIMVTGLLMVSYNKKVVGKEKTVTKVKTQTLPKEDKKFDLIFEIECLLNLKEVLQNKDFANDLVKMEDYLLELKVKDYYISNTYIDQIIDIYHSYYKLVKEPIQTIEVVETLVNIEQVTKTILKAMESFYRKAIEQDIFETNAQITALDNQLRLNGLVESDFKMFNE